MWEQCEIENYLCSRATLEAYAVKSATNDVPGPRFIRAEAAERLEAMREAIQEISSALERLGRGSPWHRDTKVSDDFLGSGLTSLHLPNLMAKKNFYELAQYVPEEEITGLTGTRHWDRDTKVSDDFLDPLFRAYFEKLHLPNLMAKKNFYELAQYVPEEEIHHEIREKLDSIARTASSAVTRLGGV